MLQRFFLFGFAAVALNGCTNAVVNAPASEAVQRSLNCNRANKHVLFIMCR